MIAPILSPGGTVGICSPSHVANFERYQPILYQLRRRGFQVIEAEHLYPRSACICSVLKPAPRRAGIPKPIVSP